MRLQMGCDGPLAWPGKGLPVYYVVADGTLGVDAGTEAPQQYRRDAGYEDDHWQGALRHAGTLFYCHYFVTKRWSGDIGKFCWSGPGWR